MVLDLNDADEQREGTSGPIPPKSIVPVRLTLLHPKPGKQTGSHPLLTRAETGMEYLDCVFEVMSGQFQGRKIWENLNLYGANSDGQIKSVDISKRILRAIVEAIRNIQPKDASPQAAQARRLNSLEELQGAFFGLRVGVAKPKAGDRYVNNSISRIITPDHEFFNQVMGGQDSITNEPCPEIPQSSAGSPAPGWAAGGAAKPAAAPAPVQGSWAAPQSQAALPVQGHAQQPTQQQSGAASAPAWAQPKPAQGAAFPTTASGMDDVPFNFAPQL